MMKILSAGKAAVIAAVIAALLLPVLFSACGGKNTQEGEDGNATPEPEITAAATREPVTPVPATPEPPLDERLTLESMLRYLETGDNADFEPRELNEREKAALRRDVEAQGRTIDFGEDGSVKVCGENGSYFIILVDGTVDGVDENGLPFGYRPVTTWPQDDLGEAVPDPGFTIVEGNYVIGGISLSFGNVSADQAAGYVDTLKSAGFILSADENVVPEYGIVTYAGTNENGISVDFSFMASETFDPACYLIIARRLS